MQSTPLQVAYRAIFTEMLLAQSAATGAFADVAARCALLAGQECERALITITRNMPPKGGTAEPAHPGDGSEIREAALPRLADSARAFAGEDERLRFGKRIRQSAIQQKLIETYFSRLLRHALQ